MSSLLIGRGESAICVRPSFAFAEVIMEKYE